MYQQCNLVVLLFYEIISIETCIWAWPGLSYLHKPTSHRRLPLDSHIYLISCLKGWLPKAGWQPFVNRTLSPFLSFQPTNQSSSPAAAQNPAPFDPSNQDFIYDY